jgi:transcriptional regulator ATRX
MIVPANTLTNWENEVDTWTNGLDEPLYTLNLGKFGKDYRGKEIDTWKKRGGLLIMGEAMFQNECTNIVDRAQPDILVLDEAHTMLKSAGNKIFQKLQQIKTKRKILLTGTPLQNNVTEYFQLINFIRPGVVGVKSLADFDEKYR